MKMYCIRCFTPAIKTLLLTDEIEWKHDPKFLGQDFLCEDYEHPIQVITERQKKILEVEYTLDGKTEIEFLLRR